MYGKKKRLRVLEVFRSIRTLFPARPSKRSNDVAQTSQKFALHLETLQILLHLCTINVLRGLASHLPVRIAICFFFFFARSLPSPFTGSSIAYRIRIAFGAFFCFSCGKSMTAVVNYSTISIGECFILILANCKLNGNQCEQLNEANHNAVRVAVIHRVDAHSGSNRKNVFSRCVLIV